MRPSAGSFPVSRGEHRARSSSDANKPSASLPLSGEFLLLLAGVASIVLAIQSVIIPRLLTTGESSLRSALRRGSSDVNW